MVPMRYIFRSRWAALAWAAGICFSAAQFVHGDEAKPTGNASNSADGNEPQADAVTTTLN